MNEKLEDCVEEYIFFWSKRREIIYIYIVIFNNLRVVKYFYKDIFYVILWLWFYWLRGENAGNLLIIINILLF